MTSAEKLREQIEIAKRNGYRYVELHPADARAILADLKRLEECEKLVAEWRKPMYQHGHLYAGELKSALTHTNDKPEPHDD